MALGPLVGRKVLRSSRSRASRVKAAESESAATVGDDAKFLAELQKRVQEVNAQLEVRRERIDRNWRRGRAKAQPAVIIQDDWVRRVALSGDEVFVGTASSGIRRHVLGAVEARQVFRVQGSPSRMVPADHQAQADPETSITSMAWNGRYLCAGLAGGRLQVWNEEAWLILDRSVDTRPCYVCVHDDVLVAAAGDSVMCWDVKNLEDLPLCKIQASCRVHCLAPAFEDSIILGLADGSVELRQLRRLSLSARRAAAHGAPVSAAAVDATGPGRLVTGDDAGRVKCWEMNEKMPGEDWTLRWTRSDHKGRIVAIQRGGGGSVLTAALDGRIIAWDAETGEFVFNIPNHKVWLGSMCLSEEQDLLVTDGRDNAVYLYNFAEE